jgi:hypothetical protein
VQWAKYFSLALFSLSLSLLSLFPPLFLLSLSFLLSFSSLSLSSSLSPLSLHRLQGPARSPQDSSCCSSDHSRRPASSAGDAAERAGKAWRRAARPRAAANTRRPARAHRRAAREHTPTHRHSRCARGRVRSSRPEMFRQRDRGAILSYCRSRADMTADSIPPYTRYTLPRCRPSPARRARSRAAGRPASGRHRRRRGARLARSFGTRAKLTGSGGRG